MVTRVTPHFRKPPSSDRTQKYHDAFFNFMAHLRRYTMVYLLFSAKYKYMDTFGWWRFVCKFMGFKQPKNSLEIPSLRLARLAAGSGGDRRRVGTSGVDARQGWDESLRIMIMFFFIWENIWLVVWLPSILFSQILGMSSSQLTFIFFRGVAQPPTRYHGIIYYTG